ncbi:ImcF-related family protein [Rhizobium beringeri]
MSRVPRASRLSPAGALGPLGEQAFERKSKAPLNEGIAGLFSATGYRTVVLPGITNAAREALDEQWVRGDPNPAGVTVDTIAQATLQLYFDAFEQRWSTILTDIRVKPSQTIGDAAETTRILASKPGPVEMITKSIVAATDLRAPGAEIASAAGDSLPASTTALASAANAPDPFGRLREAPEGAGRPVVADRPAEGCAAIGDRSARTDPAEGPGAAFARHDVDRRSRESLRRR